MIRAPQRTAQTVFTIVLQRLVHALDVGNPPLRTPMNQLGEKLVSLGAELQQMLSLQIPLTSFTGDRGNRRAAMFGQD